MTERALVRRIMRDIKAAGGKPLKIHGSGYIERGTPDIVACLGGRCVVIECKVGNGQLTKLQTQRGKEWLFAGARVFVAREKFNVKEELL